MDKCALFYKKGCGNIWSWDMQHTIREMQFQVKLHGELGFRAFFRGEMLPEEFEKEVIKAKNEKSVPFFVSACAGTTVLGAFDPIDKIADICRRYNIWLHIDCAWGGGVLLSRKHRYLVKGIEKADSVTWNPHKVMGATLQCSAILLRKPDILENCNSMAADYLFQKDKQYDTAYDTGDKTIQCGRHNDIFKLWLMWRAKVSCPLILNI
ncbi:glutamate decarboxylase gad1, partial [Cichlidogyrus casuarinus]